MHDVFIGGHISYELLFPMIAVPCVNGRVRLVNNDAASESQLPSYDLIKDAVSRGTVEVCVNNMYGSVCADNWDNRDASVLCSQLGFSSNGISHRFLMVFFQMLSNCSRCCCCDIWLVS